MRQPTRLFDIPHYQLEHIPMKLMMTSKVGGEWKSYSTKEFTEAVDQASRALLELGVKAGDKVALISHNNRCEWNIMDHALLQIGAVDVPIYPTMTEADYEYIFNHSESIYCFVSNDELYQKVTNILSKCEHMKKVFTFEQYKGMNHWSEVLALGADQTRQADVEKARDAVKPEDLATIIYTSGTTGLPKGVMLSHKNVVSNVIAATPRIPGLVKGEAKTLSFLPVCHSFERFIQYLYMYNGASIYFAESIETIKADLNYCQPTIFTAVPRLLEKFFDGIVANGTSAGGLKTKIFEWAVSLALQWEPEQANGGFYHWKLGIADKLVFSKVRAALGLTQIKAVASGSAALQPRLARFFNGIGVPILEGYGLTETAPVISVNTTAEPGMIRIGAVGKVIDGVEAKIAEDGEILAKGPNIMMGYYKQPELTAEVMTGEWFHTGDIGVIEDGFIRITDRKKEMFKTSGGKYVAPQLIENELKASHLIEQSMVIGSGRKFPAAICILNEPGVKEWCSRHDIEYTSIKEMALNQQVRDRVWKDVERANSSFGKWEQVKKIIIDTDEFTVDNGCLTPTFKVKRKPILAKYEEQIEALYAD
ncbi:long-chain fatty acid--CoA ligase [Schleiferiaceae bacterium]|jgi:long-chain acyl-CoA synthetase|nr:long-chain fatty acid--CoA ligase [Bacteroidota bacterium]MDA8687291.1 long-chain fatty acid--CoA ligase [Schleiferiaceae bacterium]HAR21329.1 long-chain fatty acid--CoA ligase [Cryomorphaceae bacterium]MCH9811093.1 long-chain fatty acid--CoA ligase [Bacteroidota bacterium]MDA8765078.1 long-chain fatty acid--CoA ligase [Schleiferiaceae bacterium]